MNVRVKSSARIGLLMSVLVGTFGVVVIPASAADAVKAWTSQTVVSDAASGDGLRSATTPDGTTLVVWRNGVNDWKVAIRAAGSQTWVAVATAVPLGNETKGVELVATPDGDFWLGTRAVGSISVSRLDTDDLTWTDPDPVFDPAIDYSSGLAMGVDGDGTVTVASTYGDVFPVVATKVAGGDWEVTTVDTSGSAVLDAPALAVGDDGQAVLAWTLDDGGDGAFMVASRPSATQAWDVHALADSLPTVPNGNGVRQTLDYTVAVGDGGTAAVTWLTPYTHATKTLSVATADITTTTWDSQEVAVDSTDDILTPRLEVTPDGLTHLVWNQDDATTTNSDDRLLMHTTIDGSTLTTPAALTDDGLIARIADTMVDDNGDLEVLYSTADDTGDNEGLRVTTVDGQTPGTTEVITNSSDGDIRTDTAEGQTYVRAVLGQDATSINRRNVVWGNADGTIFHERENQPPTAAFTYSCTSLGCDFYATDSTDDGTIVQDDWDLDGIDTANGTTPSYLFPATGTYTIGLTVTDDDGATDSVSEQVRVVLVPDKEWTSQSTVSDAAGGNKLVSATASDGTTVAVWQDGLQGKAAIRAAGAAEWVDLPDLTDFHGTRIKTFKIAATPDGDFWLAAQVEETVWMSRLDAADRTWSTPDPVFDSPGFTNMAGLAMGIAVDGTVTVATAYDNVWPVVATKVPGDPWVVTVVDSAGNNVWNPVALAVGGNGHAVLAWTTDDGADGSFMVASRSSSTADWDVQALAAPLPTVPVGGGFFPSLDYAVAVGDDGTAAVAWLTPYSHATKTLTVATADITTATPAWDTQVVVQDSTEDILTPVVDVTPDGTTHLVWNQDDATTTSSDDRLLMHTTIDGSTLTTPAALTDSGLIARIADTMVDDNGDLEVLYSLADDTEVNQGLRVTTVNGVTPTDAEVITNSSDGDIRTDTADGQTYVRAVLGQDTTTGRRNVVWGNTTNTTILQERENQLPTASFTYSCVGRTCSFDAGGSTDEDGIVSYKWEFGEGDPGTGVTASHKFAVGGNHSVTLTVTDTDQGDSSTSEVALVRENSAPTAAFTQQCTLLACDFTAVTSSDADGTIESYGWDFGGGVTATTTVPIYHYTFTSSGSHPVTLTVTDDEDAIGTVTVPVSVSNAPAASFTSACAGLVCSFDPADSTDDVAIVKYTWDFGDVSDPVETSDASPVEHLFAAGSYTVALTVADAQDQTASVDHEVVVPNGAPTAVIASDCTFLRCSFNATDSSDEAPGSIVSYGWDFGDSGVCTGDPGSCVSSDGVTSEHTFGAAGTYTVALVVTDDGGATHTTTAEVKVVANKVPSVAFDYDCDHLVCSFNGTAVDTDGTVDGYTWSFQDDDTNSYEANASHTFGAAGTYTVILTATDDQAEAGVAAQTLTVSASGQAPQAASLHFCPTRSCDFTGLFSTDDGSITSYEWDFGDGTTATGEQPSHTFAGRLTHLVTLKVTDDEGVTDSVVDSFQIGPNQAPTAAFTRQCTFLKCNFSAETSSDDDGSIVTYNWDFGDGGGGTGKTQLHEFTATGTYPVQLTVTDDEDAVQQTTVYVTVTDSFNYNCTSLKCAFDAIYSMDEDTVDSYSWAFGDGITATGRKPKHTYGSTGAYTVKLTILDRAGTTHVAEHQVTVTFANQAPTASFQYSCPSDECSFDASVSADSDGNIASYHWDFGDGSSVTETDDTASHAFSATGHYDVTLTVTDDLNEVSSQLKTVAVVVADFSYGCTDLRCEFDGGLSTDGDDGTLSYSWEFDDGPGSTATGQEPEFVFSGAGSYDVKLTVTDADHISDSQIQTVVVTAANVAPVAAFSASCAGLVCSFDPAGSTDDAAIVKYTWDFGDVSDAVEMLDAAPVEHLFAAGSYTVALTVADAQDQTGTITQLVTVARVNQAPTVSFGVVCVGLECAFTPSAADGDGDVLTYAWAFGDGVDSDQVSPTHTFGAAGGFQVTVEVSDGTASGSASQLVTVARVNQAPTVSFGVVCVGLECTFTPSAADGDGDVLTYAWAFGDGVDSDQVSPTHTFGAAGGFQVTVEVSDGTASGSASQLVTVARVNQAPTVSFGVVCVGLECTFTPSAADGDGDVLTYAWAFGDGVDSDQVSPTHTFGAAGGFQVTVEVSDGTASGSASQLVTVARVNQAPTASFTYSCTDLGCAFDGSGSADADGDDLTYAWAFGDGVMAAGATPSHTFAAGDTYSVTLTVTDDEHGTGIATLRVTVNEPAAVTYVGSRSAHATTKTAQVTVPKTVEAGDTLLLILTVNQGMPAVDTPTGVKGLTVLGTTRAKTMRTIVWTTTATAASGGNNVEVRLDHAAKTTLTIAAYDGVDTTAEPTIRLDKDLGTTKARSTPSIRAKAGSWVLSYWADKSDRTTAWTTGHATSRQSDCGTGPDHVCSLLADSSASVPAGVYDGVTARTDRASSLATLFSIVLTPGD